MPQLRQQLLMLQRSPFALPQGSPGFSNIQQDMWGRPIFHENGLNLILWDDGVDKGNLKWIMFGASFKSFWIFPSIHPSIYSFSTAQSRHGVLTGPGTDETWHWVKPGCTLDKSSVIVHMLTFTLMGNLESPINRFNFSCTAGLETLWIPFRHILIVCAKSSNRCELWLQFFTWHN